MIIRSISGVRGLIETHLNEKLMRSYARAFHCHLGDGLIYIGRDTRPSGENLLNTFSNELSKLGRDIIICGVVPTPTVQFMVERSESAGGIVITASHNPIEWNGLKFIRSDGTFFHEKDCENLFKLVDQNFYPELPTQPGMIFPDQNSILKHSIHITELSCIDVQSIKDRKFKVAIDAVNGAGSSALPLLLEQLNCEVILLYCDGNGEFKRGAEPLPKNLKDLSNIVIKSGADIGMALDPDADRLALVNENGDPLGEEYTLVIAAEAFLRKKQTKEILVTNLSTSMALEKMATDFDSSVVRTAVGEINVVNKMIEINSEFGGEGNGGVILKEAHLGRDALVGAALVLSRLSQEDKTLSEIYNSLPQFFIEKDKVSIEGIDENKIQIKVKNLFKDAVLDNTDGIKFIWDNSWVHLRKSNTEPILRIYSEARSAEEAQALIEKVLSVI